MSSQKQKIKLLVIEDTDIFRKALRQMAGACQFEIVGETDGLEGALEIIESKGPDAVILDIVLPEQDTMELIKILRERFPGLPLIACSTLKEEHIAGDVLQAGCFDYIVKPFEEKRLMSALQSAVRE